MILEWQNPACKESLGVGYLGVIDIANGTTYHLQAKQTNPDKTKSWMEQYALILREYGIKDCIRPGISARLLKNLCFADVGIRDLFSFLQEKSKLFTQRNKTTFSMIVKF